MRGGWGGGDDDRGYGGGGYDDYERDYHDRPPPPRHFDRPPRKPKDEDLEGFQPAMMSFKAFLQTQDDQISDEEAIRKYGEYKLEFKRQQLNEFFVTHKEEEWFKHKYHPDDSVKRKEELKDFLKRRVEIYKEFSEEGKFKELKLDCENQETLIRMLDSVVIKLEGGTEFDLAALDLPDPEEEESKEDKRRSIDDKRRSIDDKRRSLDKERKMSGPPMDADTAVMDKAKDMLNFLDSATEEESRKRKREDDDEDKDKPEEAKEENAEVEDKPKEQGEEDEEKTEVEKDKEEEENKPEEGVDPPKEEGEEDGVIGDKPRALHRTSSIFLRNLPPTVTKVEVEAMCKRYDGFLRSAIADPAPDRRWFRRGWVTFKREVKIKDICYNLNNIRLRDCELGPIVNRDLTKRVRNVPGLTQDKKVVRNDIKLAAKIITNLDNKWGLWKKEEGEESKKEEDVSMGLMSANPLLSNITDYLIEEASAEEEELLGKQEGEDEDKKNEGVVLQRDEELIEVLDKMIFYLRIVHSVDFYNHSEYPNEDEMPNRCGILHARGSLPATKTTSAELDEYMTTFEKKMGGFLVLRADLTNEEAAKLGLKNQEEEVEKFISANTQELGKDKWLCPLSGKKFKGPDFVRKHIMTKHVEKVEEVKKEVGFFNSYLKDPKRPQLPEHPNSKGGGRVAPPEHGGGRGDPYQYSGPPREVTRNPVYGGGHHHGGRDRGWGHEDRRFGGPPPRRDHYGGGPRRSGGGGGDGGFGGRAIITYRDWDAPSDEYY